MASDSAGLELLLRFCISNQVPGDAAVGSSKALEGLSTNKGKHGPNLHKTNLCWKQTVLPLGTLALGW